MSSYRQHLDTLTGLATTALALLTVPLMLALAQRFLV